MVQTNLTEYFSMTLSKTLANIPDFQPKKHEFVQGFFNYTLISPGKLKQTDMLSCTKNTKLNSNSNGKGMSEVKYIIDVNATLSKHKYVYNSNNKNIIQKSLYANCNHTSMQR